MSKRFKKNSVSPYSTSIKTTRDTLPAAEGEGVFKVRFLTKHVSSEEKNFVTLDIEIDDGTNVHVGSLAISL